MVGKIFFNLKINYIREEMPNGNVHAKEILFAQ